MKNLESIYIFINDCYENVTLGKNNDIVSSFLKHIDNNKINAEEYAKYLLKAKEDLKSDLSFFYDGDPAADSLEEIIMTYPGYLAISYYRIAHPLYLLGYKIEARYIGEAAHKITGIDIHPGAKIDTPFFIDHGTGVVIGETSIIGKRVKIYQGVTLGALSLSKGHNLKDVKRHPSIGDDVTIYSGVSILGDVRIGSNVTLGSNVFITKNVPANTAVTIAQPALVYRRKK